MRQVGGQHPFRQVITHRNPERERVKTIARESAAVGPERREFGR